MAKKSLVLLDHIDWLDNGSQLRIDSKRQDIIDSWVEMLKELDAHARETAEKLGPVKFDNPLPPIILFTDGGINSPHYVGDGYHRFHAYRMAGRDVIPADVTVCEDPRFEAFKHALSANSEHGIPRTNADKRNAVRQALACPQLKGYSLRQLAEVCAVTHMTISRIKAEDETPALPVTLLQTNEADTQSERPPTNKVSTPREHEAPRILDVAASVVSEEPETGPRDKLDREVPSGLLPQFEGSKRLADWKRKLSEFLKVVQDSVSENGMLPGCEHFQFQSAFMHLKSAADEFGNALYHTECPECDAGKQAGKKCKTCSGAGFLTGSMYERLPPKSKEKLSA